MKTMKKFAAVGLIRDIPKLKGDLNIVHGEGHIGKKIKAAHKSTTQVNTRRPLDLLHLDLMSPMRVESTGWNMYVFVCINDYSHYLWVDFLREK